MDALFICFNPYSIQDIVHQKLEKAGFFYAGLQNVSILTQYKALFIIINICKCKSKSGFQSLLNTRHCSSNAKLSYQVTKADVSILTQYKALFIKLDTSVNLPQRRKMFQSLLNTRHCSSKKGRKKLKSQDSEKFQSLLNTRHCSSMQKDSLEGVNDVSILTQYKALFISVRRRKNPRHRTDVSILTQYKALFILKRWEVNCALKFRFNPYSIQGIVHPGSQNVPIANGT